MAACSQASKQASTSGHGARGTAAVVNAAAVNAAAVNAATAAPPSSLEGKGACGTGKTTTLVVDGLVRLGSQCLSACRRRHYCRRTSGAVVAQYSLASK